MKPQIKTTDTKTMAINPPTHHIFDQDEVTSILWSCWKINPPTHHVFNQDEVTSS
uniref:Uncharacterized protein n=1 Tax=Helianthus annuus TaxID=4232 RepID=A0A251SNM9_HELAN